MTYLTRKKLGYKPGLSDEKFLAQDIDRLDIELYVGQDTETLLRASQELEGEARRIGNRELLALVLIQRADIHLEGNEVQRAIPALEVADISLGKKQRQTDLKIGICARLATAHARMRRWAEVLAVCEQAIPLVEAHRYKVSAQYLQSSYLRSRICLYTAGVRAAYELKQYPLMLKYAELSKARSVLRNLPRSSVLSLSQEEEQLTQRFLRVCQKIDAQRKKNDGVLADDSLLMKRRALMDLMLIHRVRGKGAVQAPAFDLDRVRSRLAGDEAVLYYYWLDRDSLLIVVVDKDRSPRSLLVSAAEQRETLEGFTRSLLHTNTVAGYVAGEVNRYGELLLPTQVKDFLKDKKRILISPHRMLHAFPFQALNWDERRPYLIQRFAITYIPNLSSLLIAYPPPCSRRVLVAGVAEYHVPGEKLRPLKKAEEEAESLHQLYEERGIEVSRLIGPQAVKDAFARLAQSDEPGPFTHLHIAVHGESVDSDNPMESYLALHDSLLDGLEIANWRLNADLVILSACCSGQRAIQGRSPRQSNQAEELPGDDVFGLQAAFFAAGARRVLGSMWPVKDGIAQDIMRRFHESLSDDLPPELALKEAIVAHIDEAGLKNGQPHFWAPFFISALGRSG